VLEIAEGEIVGSGRPHAELERVLAVLDDVWADADFGSSDLDAAWKAKAVEMFTKLYERWPGRGEPVEVELGVDAEIDGVRWVGRIDRLERSADGYRVVDYKTSRTAPRHQDAEQSIQLGFYAHAVAGAIGPVIASEMWFPRTSGQGVTTRKFAMHQLAEVSATMVEITRSIAAEDWRPRVSVDCRRCGFRRSCPAWPEGRGAFLP
jgi:RecB family exonuclease